MSVYYKHKQYKIIIPLDDIIKNNDMTISIQWESQPLCNLMNNKSNTSVKGQINRKTYLLNEIQSSKDWELVYDNEKLTVTELHNLRNTVLRQYNETHDYKLLECINEMIKNKLDIQHNLYKFNVKKGCGEK